MKKQLLLFAMILLPLVASADAVEINGICYNLITKGNVAEVTYHPNKYTGSVEIPESVNYDNVDYIVKTIGNLAFSQCYNLTSVSIPNSVTRIGSAAFQYCNRLTSVIIGNSIMSIGYNAFSGCSSLKKVIVKDIAAWCGIGFDEGSNPLYYAEHLYSDENTEIKNLVIPNNVTSISHDAFNRCSGLTSVTIPNSVTSIGKNAFRRCSSLTSLTIPNSVTNIDEATFRECYGLTSLTIPSSVTSIGDGAFKECIGLTSVNIPNSVTSIGYEAFSGCIGLTFVPIPSSMTSIGGSAFSGCTSLTSVNIPNSVTTIGGGTFSGCTNLASVTIGNGIKYIYDTAFGSCPNLTDVTCYAEAVPNTTSGAFLNSYIDYATLHVPSASVNAYKEAEPWKNFKSVVAIETKINEANNSDHAVLILSEGGTITVEGVDDRTNVSVYTKDGKQVGSAISQNNIATIATSIQPGSIAIVKVGDKAVKVIMK